MEKKTVKLICRLMLIAAALLVVVLNFKTVIAIVFRLFSALSPVITGLSLAFILNVPLRMFENKVFFFMKRSKKKSVRKLCRVICLVLTVALALGVVFLSFAVIIPQLINTISQLVNNSAQYADGVTQWIRDFLTNFNVSKETINGIQVNWSEIIEKAISVIKTSTVKLIQTATTFTTGVFGIVFDSFFAIAITIYVLLDKERVKQISTGFVTAFFNEKNGNVIFGIAKLANTAFSNFVSGQFIEALILGALCYVGMTIFGFPCAVPISVMMALLALIPILGAWIGAIVGAFLILIISPSQTLWFIVFIIVLQQLEGNLIYPKVVGESVGVPSVVVLAVVTFVSDLFGIPGILIGVPLSSVLYAVFIKSINAGNKEKAAENDLKCKEDT